MPYVLNTDLYFYIRTIFPGVRVARFFTMGIRLPIPTHWRAPLVPRMTNVLSRFGNHNSLQYPRKQSSWDQHGAHLGPVDSRWAPRWPHEPCYQGRFSVGQSTLWAHPQVISFVIYIILLCIDHHYLTPMTDMRQFLTRYGSSILL